MSKRVITFYDAEKAAHEFPILTPDYGTCSTAANISEKAVVCADFSLFEGAEVAVKFENGNTAAEITLNVNESGGNAVIFPPDVDAAVIATGGVFGFVYDGAQWLFKSGCDATVPSIIGSSPVDVEGTVLALPSSAGKALRDYKIYGNSVQVQYEGKNLLNPQAELESALTGISSYLGVNFDELLEEEAILSIKLKDGKTVPSGAYFGIVKINVEDKAAARWLVNGTSGIAFSQSKTSELSATGAKSMGIGVYPGTQENWNLIFDAFEVQFELGDTATEYEPYVGGAPSPSVDYPQEIYNVGDYNEKTRKYDVPIVVSGKNLLNPETLELGKSFEWGAGYDTALRFKTDPAYMTTIEIPVKPNCAYTVINELTDTYWCNRMVEMNASGNGIVNHAFYANIETSNYRCFSITTRAETVSIIIRYCRVDRAALTQADVDGMRAMLVEGRYTTATMPSYEPYRDPVTTTISLDEPLRKVGDVADYIDYAGQKVVRQVEVNDDTGTLPLEESYFALDAPVDEPMELPTIGTDLYDNVITVDTQIQPSNVKVTYFKKTAQHPYAPATIDELHAATQNLSLRTEAQAEDLRSVFEAGQELGLEMEAQLQSLRSVSEDFTLTLATYRECVDFTFAADCIGAQIAIVSCMKGEEPECVVTSYDLSNGKIWFAKPYGVDNAAAEVNITYRVVQFFEASAERIESLLDSVIAL